MNFYNRQNYCVGGSDLNDCGLSITVFNRFFRFYRSFGGMDPSLSSFGGAEGVPPNQQQSTNLQPATRNNLPAQKPIHGNSSNNSEPKTSKPVAAIKPVVKSVKPQAQKECSKLKNFRKFPQKILSLSKFDEISGNWCWLGWHPWKKIESPLEIVHFTKHLINSTIIKLIFERNLTVAKLKLPTQKLNTL